MRHHKQIRIPAVFMRGGTSKGVFFKLNDLPAEAMRPGPARDQLFLRMIGSPDPYGKHIDGMGGGMSSNSKVVILAKSDVPDHDVDYLFGQPAIDKPVIDWSGNCGNLTPAVGACAVSLGLINPERVPENGTAIVRVWQKNIGKTIIVHVPISDGEVQETGEFELDGVAFPAAEVKIEFIDPVDASSDMFPTGNPLDNLEIQDMGTFKATMINSGIPTVILDAMEIGFTGTESQTEINEKAAALVRLESIRIHASVHMGLAKSLSEASSRLHTPKLVFCSRPKSYTASSGKLVAAEEIDLAVRAVSMGKLHHAIMGTAGAAIATAAAVPGTLVQQLIGGEPRSEVLLGHPSGMIRVGAEVIDDAKNWTVQKVAMSRSARVIMEGVVRVPTIT